MNKNRIFNVIREIQAKIGTVEISTDDFLYLELSGRMKRDGKINFCRGSAAQKIFAVYGSNLKQKI